jgi:hypothetical protein
MNKAEERTLQFRISGILSAYGIVGIDRTHCRVDLCELFKEENQSRVKAISDAEFELTFGSDFKCIIKIKGNEISCDKAMNGFGNSSELTNVEQLLKQ